MRESPEQHLLGVVRKCSRFVARGLVTAPEFINKVFDEFAHTDRVYPDVIPDLWTAVVEQVRGEFEASVQAAVLPGFRYHAFYFGGGRPMTEEELRQDAELRTRRVQVWATEFLRWLDEAKS